MDWTKAKTVAEALEIANGETFAVKGYVVGCIKINPSKTSYKSSSSLFEQAENPATVIAAIKIHANFLIFFILKFIWG